MNREYGKQKKKDKVSFWSGFTLVETLLAVLLLSMSVVAPLTIGSSSLSSATTGRDRLVALSLARDGIELVRAVRDTNRLTAGVSWRDNLDACMRPNTCIVDSLAPEDMRADTGEALDYNAATGLYGYNDDWVESKFKRTVTIYLLDNSSTPYREEVRVVSTVTWQTPYSFIQKKVEVSSQLTNWRIQ